MTVIFIIMLFFVPSYIIGQTSFAKQTSLTEKESFSNKQSVSQKKSSAEERIPFRVMSWNVENLFDTHHDTLKNDNEFLPDAIRPGTTPSTRRNWLIWPVSSLPSVNGIHPPL